MPNLVFNFHNFDIFYNIFVHFGRVVCSRHVVIINTFHAAGVSRRQVKMFTKVLKNVNILEFGDYIWNHHDKCIQISTNMPGICLEIYEISRILRNKTISYGCWNNQWPLGVSRRQLQSFIHFWQVKTKLILHYLKDN